MRSRHAAPQARRDRDLRCSTWPFTAPQIIRTALRLPEEGRRIVAAMGSTMATLYARRRWPAADRCCRLLGLGPCLGCWLVVAAGPVRGGIRDLFEGLVPAEVIERV